MFWIIFGIVFVIFLTVGFAGVSAAPWVPTREADFERILKLADIKKGDKFYDVGCGDGRLVFKAARCGAEAYGFEISLPFYVVAKIKALRSKFSCRLASSTFAESFERTAVAPKIFFKNFWRANISDANIIYVFLTPRAMPRLQAKIKKELKKGTKIISYVWPIGGNLKPKKIDKKEGRTTLYLYEI